MEFWQKRHKCPEATTQLIKTFSILLWLWIITGTSGLIFGVGIFSIDTPTVIFPAHINGYCCQWIWDGFRGRSAVSACVGWPGCEQQQLCVSYTLENSFSTPIIIMLILKKKNCLSPIFEPISMASALLECLTLGLGLIFFLTSNLATAQIMQCLSEPHHRYSWRWWESEIKEHNIIWVIAR